MKKSNCISVAVLSMILLFSLAPVHAQGVSVFPYSHDFGVVEVGTSVSTIITILNNDVFSSETINIIELIPSSGDFSIVSSPGNNYILGPGQSVDVVVCFRPSAAGNFSATLVIINGGTFQTQLAGTGVAEEPPPTTTIQDILNFFDTSVANELLEGAGSGRSADGRLNALRNMLIQASYLLSVGNYDAACTQLSSALMRCNDFVQGAAQDNLIQMIASLMGDLGC